MSDLTNEVQFITTYLTKNMNLQQRIKLAEDLARMVKVSKFGKDGEYNRWQVMDNVVGMASLKNWRPARLAGRCVNGGEMDQGSLVHAVPEGVLQGKALCGTKAGKRSVGWVEPHTGREAVTCPKCLAAIGQLEAVAGGGKQRAVGKSSRLTVDDTAQVWDS